MWPRSRCCWTGSRTSRPDSLLALIQLCDADPRETKIDVGVGVYRDAAGTTPILRCVKAAERILLERQETKAYLGSRGHPLRRADQADRVRRRRRG
jgi:aromatic-amino-acid transaminase